ncbi:metallophosphoesterase family protein [Lichenibacterium dinghuense]|uniref:metallophosphoesterase family protein n=1 Tax=Lichenibacterium dinghuense TaxID=2895977 RepID=UPI001F2B8033|nr:metallophosphoesterase [Lichenibacterium sp. 6Y81]
MSYLLAHLSDAHIGPLPRPRPRDLMGKRITGFVNWRRRGRLHDMRVLADLVADLQAQSPDHIAMTGDILNLGLPDEFPFARAWLGSLGTPDHVSFVPGNHDAYVRSSLPHLAATFAPWVVQDGVAEAGTADGMPFAFPYLRRRGPLALIGLSSAIPTAPLLASGALGRAQRDGLARLLDEAGARGLARVVMIHHPPHVRGAKRGRGLRDAAAFEAVIARHGAELVIHGHNHRTSVAPLPGPRGPVPVVGVPSCSAVPGTHGHLAAYHLYRFAERAGGGYAVTAERRGLAPGRAGIGDLGPLSL